MEKKRRRFYFIPIIIVTVVLIISGVIMLLWNNILTDVLNVKSITFGQAIGMFILSRILFGSFRPGPPGGFRRGGPPWKTKLMNLTPEEREQFRREWQQRVQAKNEDEKAE
ncbi:hypothetical protein OCK74_00605 [Chitinophagaceae bacterium LB-8]|uniref:DUF1682 domain-containing protein n=1 Tax=Paraflavisolibacter caeni TaxID=2982496 RepID=A0A9X2XRW0_9BACT|nr:hypothetical protein [Paraflavisolibacter caeni]MCU7547586.1 hypothetical protein [Paraflavisolibacter caeni]